MGQTICILYLAYGDLYQKYAFTIIIRTYLLRCERTVELNFHDFQGPKDITIYYHTLMIYTIQILVHMNIENNPGQIKYNYSISITYIHCL